MAAPTPTVAPTPIRFSSTSNIRFIWVPTIANINAPTSAEISAGTDFTAWIGKSGISGFETSAATVTSDDILTGVDFPLADGRSISGTPTVVFKRSKTVAGSPQGLFVYGLSGNVALCDAPTLATTGALLDIWPVTVGSATKTWVGEATLTVAFTPDAVPAEGIAVPTV